jgi:hypothetical protein
MGDIGYQDGIEAFEQWYRKLSTAIDAHNKWVADFNAWRKLPNEKRAITAPPAPVGFPKIPLEGPNFSEDDQTTWPWPKKFFDNTMRTLKDDHDAATTEPPPVDPDPPEPNPDHYGIAPRTYNYAEENNSDPMFCKYSPGVTVHADGSFTDKYSRYDTNGRDVDGGRDRGRMVPGLNKSNNTNGLDPCTLYNDLKAWPDESYLR